MTTPALPPAVLANSTPPLPPIRVALVEDDPTQRFELSRLLMAHPGLKVVGTWESAEEAVASMPIFLPDVVLVDIGLPGQSGIALVHQLKVQLPQTQFMMLTVCDDTDRIFSALSAGATGYLLKKDAPGQLLAAIYDLHAGGSPMSSAIARKVVMRFALSVSKADQPTSPATSLTPREQEILALLGHGRLYKEIADQLGITYGTVRTHIRRIYEKLHAHNRTEAVLLGGVR